MPSACSTGFCDGPRVSAHTRVVGNSLPGFSTPCRVECIAQAQHHVEVFVGKQQRHQVALLQSHAMFAGDRSAHRHAVFQYVAARRLHQFQLLGIARIKQDQRMQVAVARMKDVTDAQSILLRDSLDKLKHRRNRRARHHAVLRIVGRRQPSQRRERVLAALPQQRAFVLVLGPPHLARLLLDADFPHRLCLLFYLLCQALQFDQQHRARVQRITRMTGCFHRPQRPAVEHLQRRRSDARGGNRRHGSRSVVDGLEDSQQRGDALRPPQQISP